MRGASAFQFATNERTHRTPADKPRDNGGDCAEDQNGGDEHRLTVGLNLPDQRYGDQRYASDDTQPSLPVWHIFWIEHVDFDSLL